MPLAALTVLLAPLFALYVKFRLFQIAIKVVIFGAIYYAFKVGFEKMLKILLDKIGAIHLDCTTLYILNSLDIFAMVNFAISFYAMVYLSKFFYVLASRFV